MTTHLDSVTMSHDTSWTWNLMPLVMAALALGVVFFPQGDPATADDEAARATRSPEVISVAMLMPSSPQPGLGEAALIVADLPQSY